MQGFIFYIIQIFFLLVSCIYYDATLAAFSKGGAVSKYWWFGVWLLWLSFSFTSDTVTLGEWSDALRVYAV